VWWASAATRRWAGWKLCKVLTKKGVSVRVCLEATGNYSLDVAIALTATKGVEVMIVNPRSARHFADAQLRRAKTDRVDARALLDYAQRMDFIVWKRPSQERMHLRQYARRIAALIEDTTAEKNRESNHLGTSYTFTACAQTCAPRPRGSWAQRAPLPNRPWRRPPRGPLG
jgi:transposase